MMRTMRSKSWASAQHRRARRVSRVKRDRLGLGNASRLQGHFQQSVGRVRDVKGRSQQQRDLRRDVRSRWRCGPRRRSAWCR